MQKRTLDCMNIANIVKKSGKDFIISNTIAVVVVVHFNYCNNKT